ncbi:MAG: DUF5683 domain-containing protein [Bacteroidota bacterium]|jgi:hypothetical protein|nr:DUF5683 domain-containing protein [Bacteroidota bacterium]HHU97813.1 hypothetical protein [Petrimonas sp.]
MKRGVGIFAGLLLFFTFSYATDLDVVPSDLVSTPGFVILADAVAPTDTIAPVSGISFDDIEATLVLPDSLFFSSSLFAPSYRFKPSPKKAVIYSALFPGLGQIYNRKFWKLPIVYGGFVGFTYAISWNNGYYRDYLQAYQDIMDDNPETNSWHNILPYGFDPGNVDVKWFTDVLQKRKDYYRYYRDFSIIGTVAWYLLAIVDAYVDSQLFDFDMSPDLSMRVEPAIFRDDLSAISGSSYGLQWSFRF